jgi:hypothetical protein
MVHASRNFGSHFDSHGLKTKPFETQTSLVFRRSQYFSGSVVLACGNEMMTVISLTVGLFFQTISYLVMISMFWI